MEEFGRRNFFKRIFPTVDFLYYKQFFEEDRPLNYFIDQKLFSKKRLEFASAKNQAEKMPLFMQVAMNMKERATSSHGPSGSPASGTDILNQH